MQATSKEEFLKNYREFIGVWFNDDEFKNNFLIEIQAGSRPLKDFLGFYAPWWYDQDENEVMIERALADKSVRPLKIGGAGERRPRWNDSTGPAAQIDKLRPIIIATDTTLSATVIFDSNKTLCRLIYEYKLPLGTQIATLEISGPDLQKLNRDGDFKALYQRLS